MVFPLSPSPHLPPFPSGEEELQDGKRPVEGLSSWSCAKQGVTTVPAQSYLSTGALSLRVLAWVCSGGRILSTILCSTILVPHSGLALTPHLPLPSLASVSPSVTLRRLDSVSDEVPSGLSVECLEFPRLTQQQVICPKAASVSTGGAGRGRQGRGASRATWRSGKAPQLPSPGPRPRWSPASCCVGRGRLSRGERLRAPRRVWPGRPWAGIACTWWPMFAVVV